MTGMDWLPPLILLDDHGNEWPVYEAAVYAAFQRDFVETRPAWRGRRLGLKRHPVIDGKEATYWHMVSEGSQEADRIPDLRRCERIQWPRKMIEATDTDLVHCWPELRGSELRHVIALLDFSYVVVLADRGDFLLPWTAYAIEREHTRRKLQQAFDRWKREGLPPQGKKG